jgi:hypothetical protein
LTQGKDISTSEIGHKITRSDIKTIFVAGMVDGISSLQMKYTSKELETSQYHMGETGQMDIERAEKSQAMDREQQYQHEELLIIVQSKDISKLKSSSIQLKTSMLKEHLKDKNIKQGRVASTSIMEATGNKNKKGPDARIVNLMEIFEPVEPVGVGESSEVQEQLVMKVDTMKWGVMFWRFLATLMYGNVSYVFIWT